MKRLPVFLACAVSLTRAAFAGDLLAVADGKADASDALQAEIAAKGIVQLPPGAAFRITKPIRIASNQGLVGAATLIVDFEGTSQPGETPVASRVAALVLQGENIRVEGLTLKKVFVDGSYGIGVLSLSGNKNITLRGLDISGFSARYGIQLIETAGFEISGCYVHDFLMDAGADMIVDSPSGISLSRCADGVIFGNRIARIRVGPRGFASVSPLRPQYGRQGYQTDLLSVMMGRNITITGNTLETSGEGIDLLLSTECTVTGNSIRDIWFQAIKMLGVSNSVVSGNFIGDSYEGIGLATHKGMKIECENNAVTGNVILNTGSPGSYGDKARARLPGHGTFGIYIDNTSQNNLVANNLIRNTKAEADMEQAIKENQQPNLVRDNLLQKGAR